MMSETESVYPVITLYEPWATWIMKGWKTIETRTHAKFACLNNLTILIHAGKKTDYSDLTTNNPYLTEDYIMDDIRNGYILGHAFVYDAMYLDHNDSQAALIDCGSTPRFGLFLERVNRFEELIPAKGSMGIWYYDLDKMEKVSKPTTQPKLF